MKRVIPMMILFPILINLFLASTLAIQQTRFRLGAYTADDTEYPGLNIKTMANSLGLFPVSAKQWSMDACRFFFEDGWGAQLTNILHPVVTADNWSFQNEVEWSGLGHVVDHSTELVIGLGNREPDSYSALVETIVKNNGRLVDTISMDGEMGAVVVDIPQMAISSFVSEVEIKGLSRYVEPNFRFDLDFVPNDPDWFKQWGPRAVAAHHAWDTQIGNPSVLVAIIDTGVDWNHPDLASNYIALGYDWVNNDPDPMDDHGHGTHCAGIVAAVLNNGIGVAGLAQVHIMAEKGLGPEGGYSDDLAKAIIHAVNQGANILSCSWGLDSKSTILQDALKYAYDREVLVIGAAGNEATNVKHYPAAHDEVVAVTATDETDSPAEFTNFGDWVEVAAPGVQIYSTMWDDSYADMSGTSMSAPHVSGVAALIWSQFPNMTRDQVRAQLRCTADDLGNPGFDIYYGYGKVNARRAVEQAPHVHDISILELRTLNPINVGSEVTFNTTVLNMGTSYESDIAIQFLANESLVDSKIVSFLASGASTLVSCSWNATLEGVFNLTSYVVPLPGETIINNNFRSVSVLVRVPQVIDVPDDYVSIQSAIDAALSGDTIFVASGTYVENVWIGMENMTLIGENQSGTIIDGKSKPYVVVVDADSVKISGFTIQNSAKNPLYYPPPSGILLRSSKNHKIINTTTSNNFIGICIHSSTHVTLKDNNMTGNMYNFGVEGESVSDFIHDIDTSNTVDGKSIYYWINQNNTSFPVDAGYVAAINSSNITVKDLDLTNNYQGVLLAYSSNSKIQNVNTSYNYININFVGACANTAVANKVTSSQIGIQLLDSKSNNISHNTISHDLNGLKLRYSSENMISYNNLSENDLALLVEGATNNNIAHNRMVNNTYGIHLAKSGYNVLRNNNMTNNKCNFGVTGSYLLHFIHDIDASNIVNGKPVYYLVNQKEKEIQSDAGYVALINSTNIVVRDLNLTNNIHGLLIVHSSNCRIENVNTSNNTYSISLYDSNNNAIVGNTLTSMGKRGIQLSHSTNNTISSNVILGNYVGIGLWSDAENNAISSNLVSNGTASSVGLYVDSSSNNNVRNNSVTNNKYGIKLYWSGSNEFKDNNLSHNSYNFGVYGGPLSSYVQEIDSSNLVDGRPIYYWVNQCAKSIAGNAGYVAAINCSSIDLKDLNLTNNCQGVLFAYTTNSTITNVIASHNYHGLYLESSENSTISGNNITNSEADGIKLSHSDGNIITLNTVTDNLVGIDIVESSDNRIEGNRAIRNAVSFLLFHSEDNLIIRNKASGGEYSQFGIALSMAECNTIERNELSFFTFYVGAGIFLENSSNNNTIVQNTLTKNKYGINIGYGTVGHCNNNAIYHNNFIQNTKQTISIDSTNIWDNGYPSGGNYWSNYADEYPDAQQMDKSSIWNTPFIVDAQNQDNYPLMNPWTPPNDLNDDGFVSIDDAIIFSMAYGSHLGHAKWNPEADLNNDWTINILDAIILAAHFGEEQV